ncbi:DNA translocase FtsK [Aquibacillus kalidii]|uniref:DNA translocase FtsK n=1 Tax=Aquibacillus kalidii TaxID=2762597 RepID=UPI002E2BF40F|nr:DNA translocase FtsK [Aquibacillus kalidii]
MRIFETDHVEEIPKKQDVEQSIALDQNKGIETRISYQYPSDRKINYPYRAEAPVKRESNNQRMERRRSNARQLREQNLDVEDKRKEKNYDQPQERKPFKATDVPSPVYGFHSRPSMEKSIEVPAFLRKDTVREEFASPLKQKEEQFARIDDITETTNQVVDSKIQDNREVIQQVTQIEKTHQPVETELVENTELEHLGDEEKPPNIDVHPVERENNNNSFQSEIDKTSIEGSRKAVPFNVFMTPRDKKNQIRSKDNSDSSNTRITYTSQAFKPPIHLLNDRTEKSVEDTNWVSQQIELLQTTLKHFHVGAKVVNAMQGPSVTRFEIQPEPGVKVSKIKNLSDDIKLNMAARDIRMEAPIPGKNTIGIEVPNLKAQPVVLQEIFDTDSFRDDRSPLSVALGLDIAGNPIITDLKKMPHGLIAGATGSGKSVCINTILVSLLYKASHEDVRFLLIDPKMVELAPYNDLPHLVAPVITDVKAATSALKWAVAEMEERYEKFVAEGARDIERYNQKMLAQHRKEEKLPYLVIVIDELADLMMVSPQDVEDAICRIAQKARACGIHLLLATQRPSVDVITGLIKANIPTRIAFSVSSQVDSRTIIDSSGAEKLLGKGDMLFVENGAGQSLRIQGAFVSDDEIERITNYVKRTAPPQYLFEQEQLLKQIHVEEEEDDLYEEAVDFVVSHNGASASLLQRRFKIGYNRAARLIDSMEAKNIISEQKGSKPRDVLITSADLESYYDNN